LGWLLHNYEHLFRSKKQQAGSLGGSGKCFGRCPFNEIVFGLVGTAVDNLVAKGGADRLIDACRHAADDDGLEEFRAPDLCPLQFVHAPFECAHCSAS
jgi:hypothetical protein